MPRVWIRAGHDRQPGRRRPARERRGCGLSSHASLARTLHDVGLAAWFGGSLMGAVGVNGASQEVADPRERIRIADAGWARWAPFGALAIGAHLAGSVGAMRSDGRRGGGTRSVATAALTLGALAATVSARLLAQRVMDAEAGEAARDSAASQGVEVAPATTRAAHAPADVATAQRRLHRMQWAVPALTGTLLVSRARFAAGASCRPPGRGAR